MVSSGKVVGAERKPGGAPILWMGWSAAAELTTPAAEGGLPTPLERPCTGCSYSGASMWFCGSHRHINRSVLQTHLPAKTSAYQVRLLQERELSLVPERRRDAEAGASRGRPSSRKSPGRDPQSLKMKALESKRAIHTTGADIHGRTRLRTFAWRDTRAQVQK